MTTLEEEERREEVAMNGKKLRQGLRYVIAIIVGGIVGEIVQIPLAIGLDLIWGEEVTGGSWDVSIPNIIVVVLKGGVIGYVAAFIARKRGKLIAVLANFFVFEFMLILSIAHNFDLIAYWRGTEQTDPRLWVWISLFPALVAGHFTVKLLPLKDAKAFFAAIALAIFASVTFALTFYHLFTVYVAFDQSGLVGAFLSFSFPPISEIYWFIRIWQLAGTWANQYDEIALYLVSASVFGLVSLGISALFKREA